MDDDFERYQAAVNRIAHRLDEISKLTAVQARAGAAHWENDEFRELMLEFERRVAESETLTERMLEKVSRKAR